MTTDNPFDYCYATLERTNGERSWTRFGFVPADQPQMGEAVTFVLLEQPGQPVLGQQLVTSRVVHITGEGDEFSLVTASGSHYRLTRVSPGPKAAMPHERRLRRSPVAFECMECGRLILPGELLTDDAGAGLVTVYIHIRHGRLYRQGTQGGLICPGVRCHDCYRLEVVQQVQ